MNQYQKYFQILGISATTDKAIIKKAYRKLAFKFHPDVNNSVESQSKFIEITDAYDVLLGVKKVPKRKVKDTTNKQNKSTQTTKQEREERVKIAKVRYEKAKLRELEEEARYYLGLIHGDKWKFIKYFGFICALFSVVLTLDYFLPTTNQYQFVDFLEVNDNWINVFFINGESFSFDYNNALKISDLSYVDVHTTPIFNDLKYVITGDLNYPKGKATPILEFTYYFPLPHVLLLIPLLTYVYKRANVMFTILYMISIYIVPLVFLIVMFQNWRIFQIFM